jgi:protein-L-isoaspartate(D-aspartate) O-methyltransferase
MDAVEEAFQAVPRAGFLPEAARRRASYDGPIDIGHAQTNSQPRTVADMLRLLDVRRGQRVLDVGAGSGWTTALLAWLTGPSGRVYGVEIVPDLVRFGAGNLAGTDQPWATIERAERGVFGIPDHAPYDRILVSAEPPTLPEQLVEQLATGGRMVIPVGGRMLLVEKAEGEVAVTRHGYYRFVPLRSKPRGRH